MTLSPKTRLAIVALFNKYGIIDDYIFTYIKELMKICKDIIIAINGNCENGYISRLENMGCRLYIRENIGYDGGAYKDVFLDFLDKSELRSYDEIILSNDTFYGPFYPLGELWNFFEPIDCDYWGITRHPDGENENGLRYDAHIQGYFLVIKKQIFLSDSFIKFWDELDYPKDYWSAVEEYELGLNNYLKNKNFVGCALTDFYTSCINQEYNINPYLYCCYDLVKKARSPFLKKKAININCVYFSEALKTIEYLKENKLYDIDLIWKSIGSTLQFDFMQINNFVKTHKKVYIYGAGVIGNNVANYLMNESLKFEAFVVSKGKEKYNNCINLDELMLTCDDGIIIAMNEKYTNEVMKLLEDRKIERNNILYGDFNRK